MRILNRKEGYRREMVCGKGRKGGLGRGRNRCKLIKKGI